MHSTDLFATPDSAARPVGRLSRCRPQPATIAMLLCTDLNMLSVVRRWMEIHALFSTALKFARVMLRNCRLFSTLTPADTTQAVSGSGGRTT